MGQFTSRRHRLPVLVLSALACALLLPAFGCSGKEEKPSAPGYYDGPMVKKEGGAPAGGQEQQQRNPRSGAQSDL